MRGFPAIALAILFLTGSPSYGVGDVPACARLLLSEPEQVLIGVDAGLPPALTRALLGGRSMAATRYALAFYDFFSTASEETNSALGTEKKAMLSILASELRDLAWHLPTLNYSASNPSITLAPLVDDPSFFPMDGTWTREEAITQFRLHRLSDLHHRAFSEWLDRQLPETQAFLFAAFKQITTKSQARWNGTKYIGNRLFELTLPDTKWRVIFHLDEGGVRIIEGTNDMTEDATAGSEYLLQQRQVLAYPR